MMSVSTAATQEPPPPASRASSPTHSLDVLLARVTAGDDHAFRAIYSAWSQAILQRVRFALRDPHEAEDLTQAVLMKVFREVRAGRYVSGNPQAWIWTIVRNELRDHLRKQSRIELAGDEQIRRHREQCGLVEPAPTPSWLTDPALVTHFARQNESDRQVLTLSFLAGLDNAEIAAVLGCPEGSVRTIKSRALNRLHDALGGTSPPPRATEAGSGSRVAYACGRLPYGAARDRFGGVSTIARNLPSGNRWRTWRAC